jgi:hypothetical protein
MARLGIWCIQIMCPIRVFRRHSYARSATATVRAQVLYIVLGTSLTVLASAVFSIILPVVFGDLRFYSFGPLATIGMLGAISYAILRHRLLDIRVAIQRGIIYTTLLTVIVGLRMFQRC